MNDLFVKNALRKGKPGKLWLKSIPGVLREYESRWSLTVLPPFYLNYNYVAPVILSDGRRAVLKIGFPGDAEIQSEINALDVFNGEGAALLLKADHDNSSMLIEQVIPGAALSYIKDDEKATRILAKIIKRIQKPMPKNKKFISLEQWTNDIPVYLHRYRKINGPLPFGLIEKADFLFKELLATSQEPVLLHGDLHQDNILSSEREGWLAIDPKGIGAEPAFETAAMIRNPYIKMKDLHYAASVIRQRIMILSEELKIKPERILKWCFAQTMLSAVWNVQEAKGPHHAVAIGNILHTLDL